MRGVLLSLSILFGLAGGNSLSAEVIYNRMNFRKSLEQIAGSNSLTDKADRGRLRLFELCALSARKHTIVSKDINFN